MKVMVCLGIQRALLAKVLRNGASLATMKKTQPLKTLRAALGAWRSGQTFLDPRRCPQRHASKPLQITGGHLGAWRVAVSRDHDGPCAATIDHQHPQKNAMVQMAGLNSGRQN